MSDRINELLKCFRASGAASQGDLAEETGLSRPRLSPTYAQARNTVTVRAILQGAAKLLGLDHEALAAWAAGANLPDMQERIGFLQVARKCRRCNGLFLAEDFLLQISSCKQCERGAKTPGVVTWQAQVDRRIGKAADWLREAWTDLRAKGSALSRPALAVRSGRSIEEVRAAWEEAGLPDRPARPRGSRRLSAAALAAILGAASGFGGSASATGAPSIYYVNCAGAGGARTKTTPQPLTFRR